MNVPDHQRRTERRVAGELRRRPLLAVEVADGQGRPLRMCRLSCWLERIAPRYARGRVGIALISDARMRALNRHYRQVDCATDVLSFTGGSGFERLPPLRWLGEIVIARGVARRQARQAGHSDLTELKILAVHGLLHLLGYDHEHDDGRMRRVEGQLLRKGLVKPSLLERAAAKSRMVRARLQRAARP
jgi:probable rRNA maturation factor